MPCLYGVLKEVISKGLFDLLKALILNRPSRVIFTSMVTSPTMLDVFWVVPVFIIPKLPSMVTLSSNKCVESATSSASVERASPER